MGQRVIFDVQGIYSWVRTYQELIWEILVDMGNIGQVVQDFMPGEVLATSVICRRCQHSRGNNEAM